jgi:hypothetical protein
VKTKIYKTSKSEEKLLTGLLFLKLLAILLKLFQFSYVRIFPYSSYFLACSILRIPKTLSKKLLKIFEKYDLIKLHKFRGFEINLESLKNFLKKYRKEICNNLKKETVEAIKTYAKRFREIKISRGKI